MTRGILVAGAVSFYVSVGVGEFPIRYAPTSSPRWSCAAVSGAAGHIARTLKTLGDDVRLCTVVGRDLLGAGIRAELGRADLLGPGIVESVESSSGVTFVRDLVRPATRLGVPVAVDVHLIEDLEDEYDRPWLEAARIVFCSHERLPCPPESWMAGMFRRYPRCRVVGVGLGERGAVLGTRDGLLVRVEAVTPREVVNTTGAGDALFATFLHVWRDTADPVRALRAAVVHAGWKVGSRVPVAASLTREELSRLEAAHPPRVVTGRWDLRPPTGRRDVGTR